MLVLWANAWQSRHHLHMVRLGAWLWGLAVLSSLCLLGHAYHGSYWHVTIPWWSLSTAEEGAPLLLALSMRLDFVAAAMLCMATTVGLGVYSYSMAYMAEAPSAPRYFALLATFLGAMLVLVLANDLWLLFISWELLSYTSYLLIGFEHRRAAAAASTQALVVNQLGSTCLLLALLIIQRVEGSVVLPLPGAMPALPPDAHTWLTAAGLCFLVAATAKSAQLPLWHWLPAAMEAPTPASALMHAATLVSAGAYMLLRVGPWLTPTVQLLTVGVGGLTALWGAWAALHQYHLKRLLAYATISQLGYVIMAIGMGAYSAALFHLITHALAKACLFLGVGVVSRFLQLHIVEAAATLDIRNMGGLRQVLPGIFYPYLVATLSVIGVPGCAGFWTKEAILSAVIDWSQEQAQVGHHWAYGVPIVVWGTTLLTAAYMSRQCWAVFGGAPRWQPMGVLATAWASVRQVAAAISRLYYRLVQRHRYQAVQPAYKALALQLSPWPLAFASLGFWYGPMGGGYHQGWVWQHLRATMLDTLPTPSVAHWAVVGGTVSALGIGMLWGVWSWQREASQLQSGAARPPWGEAITGAVASGYWGASQWVAWLERYVLVSLISSLYQGYVGVCRAVSWGEQGGQRKAIYGVRTGYVATAQIVARIDSWWKHAMAQLAGTMLYTSQGCSITQQRGMPRYLLYTVLSTLLLLLWMWWCSRGGLQ